MRIFLQNYRNGEMELLDVPVPTVLGNFLLVKNDYSAISVGTERYMLSLGQKSLVGKALERPDLVKLLIDKMRTEGVIETLRQAFARLETPVPLGYSSAGIVEDVGGKVKGFVKGDRVACGGYPYAIHAEYNLVPQNFVVKVPENVSLKEAAFASIGAIAIHGLRMANITFGSRVGIVGLGLIGLIAAQVALAAGAEVFALDIDKFKVDLAKKLGVRYVGLIGVDPIEDIALELSDGKGLDAVVIYAGAPKSNKPLELASKLVRERGIISAVGLVKLDVPRKVFYEKELQLVVPRSGGPGIYDPHYETKGVEYPIGYVRWSYKENMRTFLNMVASGKLDIKSLITHEYDFENAVEVYEKLLKSSDEKFVGVLFRYRDHPQKEVKRIYLKTEKEPIQLQNNGKVGIGIIGAGLFTKSVILPILKDFRKEAHLVGIASSTGISASQLGKKYGFDYFATDYNEILKDKNVKAVIISTQHNTHAKFVIESLKAGKHVFVEKPLCMNLSELEEIADVYSKSDRILMVGFNRRFSPYSEELFNLLSKEAGPMVINIRVNAGYLPPDHWAQDPERGGGRIIGEVCHFVDLLEFFSSSLPLNVYADSVGGKLGKYLKEDNLAVIVKMENGALGTITYTAVGHKGFPRERVEVFKGNSVGLIDNFREMIFISNRERKKKKGKLDRGHKKEFEIFIKSIKEGKAPVRFEEYYMTTLTTFKIIESLNTNRVERVP